MRRSSVLCRSDAAGRLGVGLCLAGLLLPAAGCRLIALPFFAFGQQQTRKVPADYPYLAGKKVAVVVWAEPYTLSQYHNVQLEVSEHVRVGLNDAVQGLTFVPNREIVAYQQEHPDWQRLHPADIGIHFGAERVLMIELTQYTTREPDSPHLRRGRMAANVKVYDTAYPDARPARTYTIETAFPADSVGSYGTDDRTIRRSMMEAFAVKLASKFHEYREKVQ